MIRMAYITADFTSVHKDLLMALQRQGIDAELFFYNRKKVTAPAFDNAHFLHYETISRGPFLFVYKHYKAARLLEKNEDLTGFGLFHGNMMFVDGYVCRYLSGKYGVPYVVSCRNTDLNGWFFWKLPLIRSMGVKNLLGAEKVLFLGSAYKEKLLKKIPAKYRDAVGKKSCVIPNGINRFWLDNRYDKERRPGDVIRFITAGRIEQNKNQLCAAEAIDRYRKRYGKSVEYIVVGKCCDHKLGQKLMEYDFVTMKEHMDKEALIAEYRSADIYIMPSHTETFGLVYPEAMTQGLPVIYSKGQGFDGQFEDGEVGVAVDSRDPDDICSGIDRILDDYELLSKNAIEKSRLFDWDDIGKRLAGVYYALAKD